MTAEDDFLMIVSISVGTILAALIAYCLFRGLRSGVMVITSARKGSMTKFRRDESPGEYWLVFAFWLILIPLIVWLVVGRVNELRHRHLPNPGVERTRTSRLAQSQIGCRWRLVPAAHARRWAE